MVLRCTFSFHLTASKKHSHPCLVLCRQSLHTLACIHPTSPSHPAPFPPSPCSINTLISPLTAQYTSTNIHCILESFSKYFLRFCLFFVYLPTGKNILPDHLTKEMFLLKTIPSSPESCNISECSSSGGCGPGNCRY